MSDRGGAQGGGFDQGEYDRPEPKPDAGTTRRPPRPPMFYEVPPLTITKDGICKSPKCRAMIFWIVTKAGGRMPIDCDVHGGQRPTSHQPGRGVPHWGTCKDPEFFRRKK
jgi:hypothetical protein